MARNESRGEASPCGAGSAPGGFNAGRSYWTLLAGKIASPAPSRYRDFKGHGN